MSFTVTYNQASFTSAAGVIQSASLIQAIQNTPAITTVIELVSLQNPGTAAAEAFPPVGQVWAMQFAGAGPLSGPEVTALNGVVAAYSTANYVKPAISRLSEGFNLAGLSLKALRVNAAETELETYTPFGSYTTISPTSIGSSQNNYSPTSWSGADIVRLTSSGNFDITGFDATATTVRKLLWSVNVSNTLTIKHESASSTAANRISCPYDQDMYLNPDAAIVIQYDSTTARWRPVSDERRPPILLSQAMRTAGTLISSSVFLGFDTEVYTTLAEYWTFDSAGTWTCQKAHTALLRATITWQAVTSGVGSLVIDFRKNGATVLQEHRASAEHATDNYITQPIEVAHAFATGDTLRLYATNFGGSPTTVANMMIMSILHVRG